MTTRRIPIPVERWRDPRHRRGFAGERAAIAYLLASGWRVEAHRFRLGRHDLDLVARRDDVVAFIEVKTRRSRRFGRAVETVGSRKRATLRRVAELWRVRFGRPGDRYRFDLVAIDSVGGRPQVTHIPDAWRDVEK